MNKNKQQPQFVNMFNMPPCRRSLPSPQTRDTDVTRAARTHAPTLKNTHPSIPHSPPTPQPTPNILLTHTPRRTSKLQCVARPTRCIARPTRDTDVTRAARAHTPTLKNTHPYKSLLNLYVSVVILTKVSRNAKKKATQRRTHRRNHTRRVRRETTENMF